MTELSSSPTGPGPVDQGPSPLSHRLVVGLAALGVLETTYLTTLKLAGAEALCPWHGCQTAFDSAYGELLGVPLAAWGMVAYATVLGLGLTAWLRPHRTPVLWSALVLLALGMVVVSAYLMVVLVTELHTLCLYCGASALLVLSIFGVAMGSHGWHARQNLVKPALGVVALSLGVVLVLGTGASAPDPAPTGTAPPPVRTTSGPAELALAQHLQATGAVMYGAWWCPHCNSQKQLFGAEAALLLPYVECASDGKNSQVDRCRATPQLKGFPTWEINGTFYSGTQSLEQLAELSSYAPSTEAGAIP